jgi:hypothetical protein
MLEYVLGRSQKIGGPNKTVEIDESKFGRRKYNRGHKVKGQWVFGGVERESRKKFLVPVPDRTAGTLMAVTNDWIETGTTVVTAGRHTGTFKCTVTYIRPLITIGFVDERTGGHTKTIESTWRHVKAFLNPYNRVDDYS